MAMKMNRTDTPSRPDTLRLGQFLGIALLTTLSASLAEAQFRPDYGEMVTEGDRTRAEQARALERERHEAMLAERKAQADGRRGRFCSRFERFD